MNRKKILIAALLGNMLIFCGVCAMDTPSGKPLSRKQLSKQEDPGVKAIGLANQYLKASSGEDKSKILTLLSEHLGRLAKEDTNHMLLATSVYGDEPNWISRFQQWQLSSDDNGDQKIQEFKSNIYDSYYRGKTKNFICSELKKTAKDLQGIESNPQLTVGQFYHRDLSILLSLLSDELSSRRKKINVLIEELKRPRIYGSVLYTAIKELCEEKSVEEGIAKIHNSNASRKKKQEQLNVLSNSFSNVKKPKGGLLLLLWQQDAQALEEAHDYLKKIDPNKTPADILEEDITQSDIVLRELPKIERYDSPTGVIAHLKKIIYYKQKLDKMRKQNAENDHVQRLWEGFESRFCDDVIKQIEKFVEGGVAIDVVLQYFPLDDRDLVECFDIFLWMNLKQRLFVPDDQKDNNYFKKFDNFLINLRKSGKSTEAERYKKILDEQAIFAIANSITSEPLLPQINYFDDMNDAGVYRELYDEVLLLNATMYNADDDRRSKNIQILKNFLDRTKKIAKYDVSEQEGLTGVSVDVLKNSLSKACAARVGYFDTILSLWQKLDAHMEIKPIVFVTAIRSLLAYIDNVNKSDIAKLEELINYPKFEDFIVSGFNTLDDSVKKDFLTSYQNVRNIITSLPELGQRVNKLLPPLVQPIELPSGQSPINEQSKTTTPSGDHAPKFMDDYLRGYLRVLWQRQQQPAVPAVVVQRHDQHDNEQPQQQNFIAVVSAAWNGLMDAISTGFAWIWGRIF